MTAGRITLFAVLAGAKGGGGDGLAFTVGEHRVLPLWVEWSVELFQSVLESG